MNDSFDFAKAKKLKPRPTIELLGKGDREEGEKFLPENVEEDLVPSPKSEPKKPRS